MLLFIIFINWLWILQVGAYRNHLFTIAKLDDGQSREYTCREYIGTRKNIVREDEIGINGSRRFSPVPTRTPTPSASDNSILENPFEIYQIFLHKFLYGEDVEIDDPRTTPKRLFGKDQKEANKKETNVLRHYVVGNYMRSELFNNRSGVHLPQMEFMHRGYCELNITKDYMQTAVNAFSIFLHGNINDIKRLPADYVLRSARTISMMKIPQEKFTATWEVVKAGQNPLDISHRTLEKYRPLFKYINGRELARLNLMDEKILTYIGTHSDLDRHQVGVVASKYIEMNKHWSDPKYLNLMNNLLCGVPMTFMRKLPVSTYLQLSHQAFYHIHACDPLQRRFYLAMMTRTKALGKSFSWTARDVSRLGLLLTEVNGNDLNAINPAAMAGVTAQVMLLMSPQNLQYLTETQIKHLGSKAFNIMARKLKMHNDHIQMHSCGLQAIFNKFAFVVLALSTIIL